MTWPDYAHDVDRHRRRAQRPDDGLLSGQGRAQAARPRAARRSSAAARSPRSSPRRSDARRSRTPSGPLRPSSCATCSSPPGVEFLAAGSAARSPSSRRPRARVLERHAADRARPSSRSRRGRRQYSSSAVYARQARRVPRATCSRRRRRRSTARRGEIWELLKTGRRFRALGRTDAFRLLRWGPMAVADLVSEWFETELLRAAIAARGIFGGARARGPPGRAPSLLLTPRSTRRPAAARPSGGPGALTRAMADAASQAGAEIRHGRGGRPDSRAGRPRRWRRALRRRESRRRGRLGRRPQAHAALPRRPGELDPELPHEVETTGRGHAAKVNLALAGCRHSAASAVPPTCTGRIHIGPDSTTSSAPSTPPKYGEISPAPYLDVTIPTLPDPSLAPAGRTSCQSTSSSRPTCWRGGRRGACGRRARADRLRTLEAYAPGIGRSSTTRRSSRRAISRRPTA